MIETVASGGSFRSNGTTIRVYVYRTDGFSLRDLEKRCNDADAAPFNCKTTAPGTTGLHMKAAAATEISAASAQIFRFVECVGTAQD
jgi:hypothetical protein